MKKRISLLVLILLVVATGCRSMRSEEKVMQMYIAAFNAHDEAAMKEIVADTAKYGRAREGRPPRLLLDNNKGSWEFPVTSTMKLTTGTREGKKVLVGWIKAKLQDGTYTPLTKVIYFELEISGGMVRHADGILMLDEPAMRDKIIAPPPE
jgi:hypothetical protein